MKSKKAVAAALGVTCVLGVGGVGVVQAQTGTPTGPTAPPTGDTTGDDPRELPTGFTVQPIAGERDISLERDVPPEVRHTAEQAAPDAVFNRAQIDFDNVEAEYELRGATEAGDQVEIDVFESGRLAEIEERILRSDVPRLPLRLLKREFGKDLEVTLYERSTRPTNIGFLRVFYEFDAVTADGRELDIEINQRGTVYTVEPLEAQRPAPGIDIPPTP
jgi:hypothetical protein